jgi:hypothetical protein
MHKILTPITIALLFLAAASAPAEPLASRLSTVDRDARGKLLSDNLVRRDLDSWRDVSLIPDHPFRRQIRDDIKDARLNVLSEQLILVDRAISDEEFLALYNSLRHVRDLDDIEYYNPEAEVWYPLFDGSYRVTDEESTTPMPDPIARRIPGEDSFLVRQGLPPFGENVSRYEYRHRAGAILFSSHNLTRIKYKGFPVVGPEEMVTHFLMIREPDYLLVYAVGGAQVFNFLGLLSGVIENSFTSRTTGLFEWYSKNYLDPLRDGQLVSATR